MNNWKETRTPPPSVEHLKYFKIWAISNTISSGVLILILLCLVAFLVQTAYNMSYKRLTLQEIINVTQMEKQIENEHTKF